MAALILSTTDLSRRSIFFIDAGETLPEPSEELLHILCRLRRGIVQVHGPPHDKERYALPPSIIFEIFDYLCRRNCVQGGREHAERVRDRKPDPLFAVVYAYDPVHPANLVNYKYVRKK